MFLTSSVKFPTPLNYKIKRQAFKKLKYRLVLNDFVDHGIDKTIYDLKIKKIKCFIIDKNDCSKKDLIVKTALATNFTKVI